MEAMSASNCLTSTWKDLLSVWREDERIWHHLLELELQACRQPGCLDMGSHILAMVRIGAGHFRKCPAPDAVPLTPADKGRCANRDEVWGIPFGAASP